MSETWKIHLSQKTKRLIGEWWPHRHNHAGARLMLWSLIRHAQKLRDDLAA